MVHKNNLEKLQQRAAELHEEMLHLQGRLGQGFDAAHRGLSPLLKKTKREELRREWQKKVNRYRDVKRQIQLLEQTKHQEGHAKKVQQCGELWGINTDDPLDLLLAAYMTIQSFSEHGYPLNKDEKTLLRAIEAKVNNRS